MSLGSSERAEYERIVLESLREILPVGQDWLLGGEPVTHRGGSVIRIQSVELDEGSIVVLFRDVDLPERLLEWRMEAVEPDVSDTLTSTYLLEDAAKGHATVVWVNFEESLIGGPRSAFREVPETGSPPGS
jgi:hypothetical protein